MQSWLERVKDKRRRSKGFRTLEHRESPLFKTIYYGFMTHSVLGSYVSVNRYPIHHTLGRFLRPNLVSRVPKYHRSLYRLTVCRKEAVDTSR